MSYVPIRTSTLRGDQKISFDIFLLLNEKFIPYIRTGDSFEGGRLTKLKEKKVKKLYITPGDEAKYREYIQKNIEMAYDPKSNQALENRASVIQGHQQSNTEAVMENPKDEVAYNTAKDGSSKLADFIMREEASLKAVLALENTDQNLAAHGVTVSSIAVGIAKRIGYVDPKNLQFLVLGGLMHDLGHYYNGLNIARSIADFTPEELAKYKAHPHEAAEMVRELKHFDQNVIQIIAEHEECIDGSGFPLKLVEKKINPMSVMVGLANAYDRMVSFEKTPSKDAIKRLVVEKIGRYPLAQINAMKAIVKELTGG